MACKKLKLLPNLYMVLCVFVYWEIYTGKDEATTILQTISKYLLIHTVLHPSKL
jgi:hypothetical protein